MPTFQEILEERRKKRMAQVAAPSADTAIAAPPQEEPSWWKKLTTPEPVPGGEPGFNAETLRNVGRAPFQMAEGLAHTAKDVATLGAGSMVPLANIHPKFREQYMKSAQSMASMPQALAQPILDAFTSVGANPLAGGANPIVERMQGKQDTKERYPQYGEALERLSQSPLGPALSAAGVVDLGMRVKIPKKVDFPKRETPPIQEGPTATKTQSPPAPISINGRQAKVSEFVERAVRKEEMTRRGQDILDMMEERGESPRQYVESFWRDIYDGLSDADKQRADNLVQKYYSGVQKRPGETWKDIGLDLAREISDEAQYLEGTDRGFVVRLASAAEMAKQNLKNKPPAQIGGHSTAGPLSGSALTAIPPPPIVPPPSSPLTSSAASLPQGVPPHVATALRTSGATRAKSRIGEVVERVKTGFKDAFEYEHTIKDFPELVEEVHVFKSTVGPRVADQVTKVVVDVVKDLDRSSYLQFQDMVNLRNHRMTALRQTAEGRPVKLPNKMSLADVEQAIQTLEPTMSPTAQAALKKHGALVTQIGDDLVQRGVIPKTSVSPDYFPNQVLSYLDEYGDYLAGGGRSKMKVPYREYAQKRRGSERPIETDYRRAMIKYLSAYASDNATIDFLGKQVNKYDIRPSLSSQGNLPSVPGQVASGKVLRSAIPEGYVEFVPESAMKVRQPSKQPINNPTPLEQAMMDDINAASGGEFIRPDAAVIPVEIANRFRNFGDAPPPSLMRAVNKANGLWKAWTIGAGGAKFTIFQLTGDALNLFREDAKAFASAPKALKAQVTRSPLYDAAKKRGVVGSGFVGKEVPDIIASTKELAAVGSPMEKLSNAVYRYNPFRFYRDFQIERENFLRMTKFVADMDRGLGPIKSGKAAREFTVDYGKFTPQENTYLRGALAPFYAFAKQNTGNWIKYVADRPVDASLKFVAPYYAASLWNEEKFPEVDNKIPSWMKDQMYVILDANDSTATVLSFATPADDMLRKFGLAHPRRLLEQFINADIPGIEPDSTLPTGLNALKEVPGEAVKEWANLLSPAVKLPIELTANRSIFSGAPIEKVGERTLPDSMKTSTKGEYALGSLFRPYREVTMFGKAAEKNQLTSRFLPVYEVDLKNPFAGKDFEAQEEIFNQMLRALEGNDDAELQRLFQRYGGTISPRALQRYFQLYGIQRAKMQQKQANP